MLSSSFPVYAVPLNEVLELEGMTTHEELRPRIWRESDGPLCFVSHQWTGVVHPDPSSLQFSVLKDTLMRLDELFADHTPAEPPPIRLEEHSRLWIWLDYWSVPQAPESVQERIAAIESIPSFAIAASFLLVLCPPVRHQASGAL